MALKGERTVSELATAYGVHPTMAHPWNKALLEGAAGVFERGGRKTAEVDEDTVRDLHGPRSGSSRTPAILRKACVAPLGPRPLLRRREGTSAGQALDRHVRRGMIERDHLVLAIDAQCRLLSIARPSFYHVPQGETETNLALSPTLFANSTSGTGQDLASAPARRTCTCGGSRGSPPPA